jgi:hypothetical protein
VRVHIALLAQVVPGGGGGYYMHDLILSFLATYIIDLIYTRSGPAWYMVTILYIDIVSNTPTITSYLS